MTKSVLITRPRDQALESKRCLEDGGFEVFVEPIFLVRELPLEGPLVGFTSEKKVPAIIVTSGNAVGVALQAIGELNLGKSIKIFAVGKITAQRFLDLGFGNVVYSSVGSAQSLKEMILQDLVVLEDETLLYFCGEIVSLDFKKELSKYDIKLEKIISYKIVEEEKFSDEFLKLVKESNFDYSLIYSRNSAKNFFRLLKKHGLIESFERSRMLCLSENVLSFVRDCGFKNSATFDEIPILKNFYE